MAQMLEAISRGLANWGALALLVLLTTGVAGYAVALGFRAWWVARQGLAGVRAQPWPLIGLLCGAAGVSIAALFLATAWLAGSRAADVLFYTRDWPVIPMIVCGWVFVFTAPSRRISALERAQYASMREHPRQALAGFAFAALTWLPLPLAALPGISALGTVHLVLLSLAPLALIVELCVVGWWLNHNGLVEITEGERARLVPAALLQPAFQGWFWGTAFSFLIFAMLGQTHTFP